MDELFENILHTEYIEEVFDEIENKPLRDYYALFISAMAYYKFIDITPEFSAKLYITILKSTIKDSEQLLDKMFEFLINKTIDRLEQELNAEEN